MPRQELTGRLVLDERVVPGRIVVENGLIAAVLLDEPSATDSGRYLAPGFVDVHVHGWGGHDVMGGIAALDGLARALARRGVTSFLPTAVSASLDALAVFAREVRAWRLSAPDDGAAPLGFNLEGPFLAAARKGAHDPTYLRVPADTERAELAPLFDGLRLVTIAPELPGALELIADLRARGVAVGLGHSAATFDEARAGYAAGASSTTHLFNAMTGIHHRTPGLAVAALTNDDAYVELIADGQHVNPSLWPLIVRAKGAGRLILVSDAIPAAGTGHGSATLGGVAVEVRGQRATLLGTDTLAGSVIALDDAVRGLTAAGIPLATACRAASWTPLSMLGLTDRGRLAVGQRADLVELDDGLRVRRTMVRGRWVSV